MYGHQVTDKHHGVTPDGMRYFGLISLRSTYTGYEDTVGLRNSHDKSFPISIGFGSRVFVCDNLAFIAETTIKRRHTANVRGAKGRATASGAMEWARTQDRVRQIESGYG
jgi:hypothetical protein